MHPSKTAETYLVDSASLAGRRCYKIRDADWRALEIHGTAVPGYTWIPLSDDEGGGWTSYWMRIDAGAQGPMHQHPTTELILVVDGVFTDSDGSHFQAGDALTYPAGSSHSSCSAQGCTVLVVARASTGLTDQPAR